MEALVQKEMAMFVTARNAPVKPSSRATWKLPEPIGRSAATSPTVIKTAVVMDKQAVDKRQYFPRLAVHEENSQAIDM